MTDPAEHSDAEQLRPFFYDIAEIPGYTIEQMVSDPEDREMFIDTFGRSLVTKTVLHSPRFSVYHESAEPRERVKPHRHGTHQLTYVLRGELNYGSRCITAGMGHFSPDTFYSWRAGDEGAEWLEIHAGDNPGVFLPTRRERDEQPS